MSSRIIRGRRGRLLPRVAAVPGVVESLEARRLLRGTIELLPLGSEPGHLADVNGTLSFTADGGVHGPGLWKIDGSTQGTKLVRDIQPGEEGSWPECRDHGIDDLDSIEQVLD